MCKYKSAIVVRDEKRKGGFRLLVSPWTESHSELCQIFNLNDSATAKLYFARVEFSPDSLETAHLVETYKFKLDEERTPEWWDPEIRERVIDQLKTYIQSIIVVRKVDLLIGGQFILGPGADVGTLKYCTVTAMLDSAKVGTMWDSAKVENDTQTNP